MKAVKIKSGLTTGVTQEEVTKFIIECGNDYKHLRNEQYPVTNGPGMRERIIAVHNDAKEFYSEDVELGSVFTFSQDEANEEFEKRSKNLYD